MNRVWIMNIKGVRKLGVAARFGRRSLQILASALVLLPLGGLSSAALAQTVSVRGELAFTLTGLGSAEMLDVSDDGRYALLVGGKTATLVAIAAENLSVVGTWTLTPEFFPACSTDAEITGVSISPDGSFALLGSKIMMRRTLAPLTKCLGMSSRFRCPACKPWAK